MTKTVSTRHSRPDYQFVVDRLRLLTKLAAYDPIVIGTPPLGIDIESSDIDIACHASDLEEFSAVAKTSFSKMTGFAIGAVNRLEYPAVRACFSSDGWPVELFCQTLPVSRQWGVRHFMVEQRILAVCPRLGKEIVALKESGLKTEAAFAALLHLQGDPYEAVLSLEACSDEELDQLLRR